MRSLWEPGVNASAMPPTTTERRKAPKAKTVTAGGDLRSLLKQRWLKQDANQSAWSCCVQDGGSALVPSGSWARQGGTHKHLRCFKEPTHQCDYPRKIHDFAAVIGCPNNMRAHPPQELTLMTSTPKVSLRKAENPGPTMVSINLGASIAERGSLKATTNSQKTPKRRAALARRLPQIREAARGAE